MKKIVVVIFILAFASIALAEEKKCDSVSGAEDLWNFNMKSEALACLDEVIQADPTNVKAHFLKGKMCLATNDYICAKERFGAGPVRAKYRDEIAELYKAIGDNRFASGNAKEAEGYYREASLYNPALAKTVASELAKKGKELNSDNNYLMVAARLDPSLKTNIADHFATLSENSETDEEKVDNLKRSSQYDAMKYGQKANDASEALGRAFLAKAMENARKVGQEANTEKFKALARKYLGDAVVEAELPEVRKFSKGEFDLGVFKAGEQTPYRIDTLERSEVRFKATNRNIKLVFKDGREFCLWKEEDKNKINNMSTESHLFKIVAVADVDITLVVK